MIIRNFTMDGFGIFAEQSVNGLPDGISIFLGNNEAGKTTCLRFFRHVLFGFPTPSHKEFTPALRGGTPGGSLLLHTGAHGLLRMERRPGVRGGPISLQTESGTPLEAAILETLLGGVTKEVYEAVYGFSLSELQELASLNGEKVRHALYGASFGAATRPVGQVLKSLDAAMDALYKSSGQKPQLNRKLAELDDVLRQLKESDNAVLAYEQTTAQREAMATELETLQTLQTERLAERAALERRLSLWEQAERLQQLRVRLASISPAIDNFPTEGIARLDRLRDALAERHEDLQGISAKLQRLQERQQQLNLPAHLAMLKQQHGIAGLAEEKSQYRSRIEQLRTAETALDRTQSDLNRILEALGNEWDTGRLRSFDRSLFTQERIEQFARTMQQAEAELLHAREQREIRKRELQEALAGRKDAQAVMERFASQNRQGDPALVEELASRREHVRRLLEELPRKRQVYTLASQELDNDIAKLVPDWTRERIRHLDTSFTARESVATAGRSLADTERSLHDATVLHQAVTTQLEPLDQRLRERQAELQHNSAPTREEADARRSSLRTLRNVLRHHDEVERRLNDLHAARTGHAKAGATALVGYTVLSAMFLAGCYLGLVALDKLPVPTLLANAAFPLSYLGAALVASSLLGATLLSLRSRSSARGAETEVQLALAESELQELAKKIQALCPGVGINSGAVSLSDDELERAELATDAMRDAAENRARLLRSMEELRQERERLLRQATDAARTIDKARNERDLARQAWSVRTRELQLPATTTPEVALSIFDRAEGMHARLQTLEVVAQETEAMRQTVENYLALAGSLPAGTSEADTPLNEGELLAMADKAIENARQLRESATERARAAQVLAERHAQVARCEERVQNAVAREAAVTATLATQTEKWQTWLDSRGLARTLSPTTALGALRLVNDGVALLDSQEQLQHTRTALQTAMTAYADRQDTLLAAAQQALQLHPPLTPEGHVDRPAATDLLSQTLAASREAAAEHAALAREVPELQDRMQACQDRMRSLDAEYRALLEHGGALEPDQAAEKADEDASALPAAEERFRQRGTAHAARMAVLNELTPLQASLEAALASGEKAPEDADDRTTPSRQLELFLAEPLSDDAKAQLAARLQTLLTTVAEDRKREDELRQQISDSNTALKGLASAEQVSDLRNREAAIREDLRILSRQWARHAMARQLVLTAKRSFEQQRQPAVIQHASGFFRTITGGTYSGLHTSLDDDSIRAIREGGESRLPEQLSRGTREQLFLALRLGFILSHSAGGEALPVIMDDILVNFDPGRAARTAEALSHLSEHNQILFFTCHPQTAEILMSKAPSAALYTVADGTITNDTAYSGRGFVATPSPA